jgi:hypothetical protein
MTTLTLNWINQFTHIFVGNKRETGRVFPQQTTGGQVAQVRCCPAACRNSWYMRRIAAHSSPTLFGDLCPLLCLCCKTVVVARGQCVRGQPHAQSAARTAQAAPPTGVRSRCCVCLWTLLSSLCLCPSWRFFLFFFFPLCRPLTRVLAISPQAPPFSLALEGAGCCLITSCPRRFYRDVHRNGGNKNA